MFSRWMRKNNLSDDALRQAVTEMAAGLDDAGLEEAVRLEVLTEINHGNH